MTGRIPGGGERLSPLGRQSRATDNSKGAPHWASMDAMNGQGTERRQPAVPEGRPTSVGQVGRQWRRSPDRLS